MPDFPDLGLASRSAAFNRVLIFIALGELCILVGIAAILAEPLAHLLTGQPCSARYPANLRPFAGRFMQEVEPVLMLNANLLFAVIILIAQPPSTAPAEYHIIAIVRHRVVRSEEHTSALQSLMRNS